MTSVYDLIEQARASQVAREKGADRLHQSADEIRRSLASAEGGRTNDAMAQAAEAHSMDVDGQKMVNLTGKIEQLSARIDAKLLSTEGSRSELLDRAEECRKLSREFGGLSLSKGDIPDQLSKELEQTAERQEARAREMDRAAGLG